jgi:hypothetical protein
LRIDSTNIAASIVIAFVSALAVNFTSFEWSVLTLIFPYAQLFFILDFAEVKLEVDKYLV